MFIEHKYLEPKKLFVAYDTRRDRVLGFFLFMLSPLLAVVSAAFNFGKKHYRFLIVLYFGFIGYTYIPSTGADAYRNGQHIEEYAKGGFELYKEKLTATAEGESRVELFLDTLAFLLSYFSSNPGVLFAGFGIVYGIFYIIFIGFLYDEYKVFNKPNINSQVYFLAMAFYLPVMQVINGRFWLAYGIALVIIYQIVIEKKSHYLAFVFLLAIIHQGILLIAAILSIYVVSNIFEKRRNFVFYGLIVFAYIFQAVGVEIVRDVAIWMGGGFEKQVGGYIGYDDEARTVVAGIDFESEKSWFVVVRGYFMLYSLLATIFITRFFSKLKNITFDRKAEYLYSFFLLFWAIHTFVAEVPSMGSRYLVMLNGIGILLLFMVFRSNTKNYLHYATFIFLPAYALNFVVEWRIWFEWTSTMVLYGNPVIAYFMETETTIWDIIPY